MFVTYTNRGGEEVIITTVEKEQNMLKEYFGRPAGEVGPFGRDLDDYDRYEDFAGPAVTVTPTLRVA